MCVAPDAVSVYPGGCWRCGGEPETTHLHPDSSVSELTGAEREEERERERERKPLCSVFGRDLHDDAAVWEGEGRGGRGWEGGQIEGERELQSISCWVYLRPCYGFTRFCCPYNNM